MKFNLSTNFSMWIKFESNICVKLTLISVRIFPSSHLEKIVVSGMANCHNLLKLHTTHYLKVKKILAKNNVLWELYSCVTRCNQQGISWIGSPRAEKMSKMCWFIQYKEYVRFLSYHWSNRTDSLHCDGRVSTKPLCSSITTVC